MNKAKLIYKLIAIIIVVSSFIWFWQYNGQILNLSLFGMSFEKPLSVYSGCVFFLGFVTAVISCMGSIKSNNLKTKEYEKKLSTTSVNSSKDKSKIEALERKIATLEKALESKIEENK